jgi:type II secretion system protein N
MGGWRSRPLLVAFGIAVLFVGFVVARFPYERLLPAAEAAASNALGARVEIGRLGIGLGWGGPEAVGEALHLRWPGGDALRIERVGARPAWTLAWLGGRPRWYVTAAGPPGRFAGEVAPDRVDGAFEEVEVTALPWATFGGTPPLRGRLSGAADLTHEDGAWQGFADVTGENGTIDYAGLPVAIPYEHLAARIELSPGELALPAARLEGPLVTARFSGAATPGPGEPARWPLELRVEVERVDPALRSYLAPLGIRLDRQGQASLRVSGTLAAPIVTRAGD